MIENEVMKTMLERRAIRRFKGEQISREELETILNAGMYAPSAGGRQGVIFAVSQDAEVNEQLGRTKRANSTAKMTDGKHFVSTEQPSIIDDPNIKSGFYGAPTVVTLFGVKGFLFADSDCACAAENMMLAATSLGIGSCYIGTGWEAFASDYGQEVLRKWAVPVDHFAVCQVLLGYPLDGKHPDAKPRKDRRVIWGDAADGGAVEGTAVTGDAPQGAGE